MHFRRNTTDIRRVLANSPRLTAPTVSLPAISVIECLSHRMHRAGSDWQKLSENGNEDAIDSVVAQTNSRLSATREQLSR